MDTVRGHTPLLSQRPEAYRSVGTTRQALEQEIMLKTQRLLKKMVDLLLIFVETTELLLFRNVEHLFLNLIVKSYSKKLQLL